MKWVTILNKKLDKWALNRVCSTLDSHTNQILRGLISGDLRLSLLHQTPIPRSMDELVELDPEYGNYTFRDER